MAAAATAELNISSGKHRSVYNENVMDWQQNPPCMRAIYERKSHDARNTTIKYGMTKIDRKRKHEVLVERCAEANDAIKIEENVMLELQAGKENEMICKPEDTMLKNAENTMGTRFTINDELREVVQSSETLSDITAIQLKSPKQHKVVYNRTNHNHSVQKGQKKASQLPNLVTKKSQPELVTPPDDEKIESCKRIETEAECSRKKPMKKGRVCTKKPPSPPLKLPKLHLVLTRNEILEDWVKITGQKYTGKPRKSTIAHMGLGLCTSLTCPSTIRYLKGYHVGRGVHISSRSACTALSDFCTVMVLVHNLEVSARNAWSYGLIIG